MKLYVGWVTLVMLVIAGIAFGSFLQGCASLQSLIPNISIGSVQADCILADELQKPEVVTPLPEDHQILLPEQWTLLKDHLVEEKGIADRSNDKTAFVNKNCRGTSNGTVK